MRFIPRSGRRLSPLILAFALFWGVAPADAGVWSTDFNITDGDIDDTFTSLNNQRFVTVDDSNNVYVAFFDNRNKTASDNNFEIYFRRFTFQLGSLSITRVTDKWNMSKYPSLGTLNWGQGDAATANDSGRVYIAWQDARLFSIPLAGEPISYTIFLRTYRSRGGTAFGPEIQVSPYDSLAAATSPVLAAGDSSRVWVVWQKADALGNPDLYSAVYKSSTGTVGPTIQLTNNPAFSGSPTIATTRDGVVHLVWVDTRTGLQALWTKRFVPGSGWTADQQLVFSPALASQPSLTSTYTGRLHLTWRDNRDGNNEIYYKEYRPGLGWDPVDVRLTINTATQSDPYVDADPSNNVYLVWTDQRNGSLNPDIFYQERTGGVWRGEVPLVYAATDSSNSIQQFPGITHDAGGSLYVAWTDQRLPSTPPAKNKDVYYKYGTGFVTGVETSVAPSLTRLLRNYPNPFNPATKIVFRLDRDSEATLRIFDVNGRLVRTLVDSYLASGSRTVEWDGRDDQGRSLASGTYYMRLQAGGEYVNKSLNLLK